LANEIITISFDNNDFLKQLLGKEDQYIKLLEKHLNISISARGSNIYIDGPREESDLASTILQSLYRRIAAGNQINTLDFVSQLKLSENHDSEKIEFENDLILRTKKRNIIPFTAAQRDYLAKLRKFDIVFSYGPAGTGKSYLAVAYAISLYFSKKVDRIILSRPAIEAGEKLGFLPGDLKEKVDPYLRPLYDALYDMVQPEVIHKFIENGEIEIAPLAFMRGRTLNNAVIILDEAQNTTPSQMKMFLTRIGSGSQIIVTGDPSQTDLPPTQVSGLTDAIERLAHLTEDIGFCGFNDKDIIRHPLTAKIVAAYKDK
jgi:phosphate starvation-inducible PhoH-like protein